MTSSRSKKCIGCFQRKPHEAFYRHPEMIGGRLNKCAACCKAYARARRLVSDAPRESDLKRYRNSPARRARQAIVTREWRLENPAGARAHRAVAYALRVGKLTREPCEVCAATSVHAHHDDYAKPLDVRWLCPLHHARDHQHGVAIPNRKAA